MNKINTKKITIGGITALLCLITLVFNGCKKVNHKKDLYVDITLDGNRKLFVEGKKNYTLGFGSGGCGSGAYSSTPHDVIADAESNIFKFSLSGNETGPWTGVRYTHKFIGVNDFPWEGEVAATITSGTTTFGRMCELGLPVSMDSLHRDGFIIFYYDETGTEWTTDKSTGDQTGHSVKVVEAIDNPEYDGDSGSNIVWLEFDCTLYNDSGNSMEVTEGNLRLLMF